jgi:hypothetical protein
MLSWTIINMVWGVWLCLPRFHIMLSWSIINKAWCVWLITPFALYALLIYNTHSMGCLAVITTCPHYALLIVIYNLTSRGGGGIFHLFYFLILIQILMWYVDRNQSWYVATGRELTWYLVASATDYSSELVERHGIQSVL